MNQKETRTAQVLLGNRRDAKPDAATARTGASAKDPTGLFRCQSVAELVRAAVERMGSGFTFASVATAMGVSASYLSKALAGRAHLSGDHLELAACALGLSEDEHALCDLLAERERASVPARAARLDARINALRRVHLDVSRVLPRFAKTPSPAATGFDALAAYHADPWNVLVHAALTIARYRSDPAVIATDLRVPLSIVFGALARLEQLGLAQSTSEGWRSLRSSLHLPKSSPHYRAWSALIRSHCAAHVARSDDANAFLVSVTFSATPRERDLLRDELLALLSRAQARVSAAREEELYQLNLDLFAWA